MKIAVIGTGYVGLVSGTCFSEMGHQVICVDIDEEKISQLEKGDIPIYEPGLSELVIANHKDGRLQFTTSLEEAVRASRVVFIAVGTPSAKDGSADLSAVFSVAEAIGKAADGPKLIVDKSTVPVGTAAKVKAVAAAATSQTISVCSNPEFLKEGAAIEDFMKPDRVVIGAESDEDFELMEELYAPFVRSGKPILRMDPSSAEMTKYASNAMLATRISFMNEIARICSLTDADVSLVRKGMGTDTRIGQAFLYPGIGYGGSCFPKDVQALARTADENGYEFKILEAVEAVNQLQKKYMAEKLIEVLGKDLSGKRISLWGLAFKPRTDDMREAPSLTLARELTAHGAEVRGTDPEAIETARAILGDLISYHEDPYEAAEAADALILCTEWNEFRRPDLDRLGKTMKRKLIFDGRNILSAQELSNHGFERYAVGLPPIPPT